MTTAAIVRGIIADHLGVDREKVIDCANFSQDLNADSLDHIELTMAFEQRFLVEIADEDAEAIRTVGDAVKLMERKAGFGS